MKFELKLADKKSTETIMNCKRDVNKGNERISSGGRQYVVLIMVAFMRNTPTSRLIKYQVP